MCLGRVQLGRSPLGLLQQQPGFALVGASCVRHRIPTPVPCGVPKGRFNTFETREGGKLTTKAQDYAIGHAQPVGDADKIGVRMTSNCPDLHGTGAGSMILPTRGACCALAL